jgi:hypothetical protein
VKQFDAIFIGSGHHALIAAACPTSTCWAPPPGPATASTAARGTSWPSSSVEGVVGYAVRDSVGAAT